MTAVLSVGSCQYYLGLTEKDFLEKQHFVTHFYNKILRQRWQSTHSCPLFTEHCARNTCFL